jgi:amino acid adenylation domain-containing protein
MAWGRGYRGGAREVPPRTRVREGLRLSPNEERYILAETLTGQVYAVPSGARFKGPVDFDTLRQSLQDTCDRHEARRTGYQREPDGRFTKYVEDRATVHIERIAMPGASDADIIAAVNAHVLRKGDFSPAQLHRYIYIDLGPDDCVFAFGLHHATSDGVSFSAFVAEVYARLLGFPAPESSSQYSDFWDYDWAQSDAYLQAKAFWHERLDGIGDPGAWPEDRARAHSQARLSAGVELSAEAVSRTEAAAKAIGVTHFSYFYAVYLVLLSRMIGSDTVVTTFQSAGRKGHPGSDRALGVFSNALINATRVDPAMSIADLARQLRGEVKAAIAHEIYPYHHAIRETGVRARYAINWMPQTGPVTFADIEIIPMLLSQNQDDDDLNLRFSTYMGQVRLLFYYDPSAYEAERVRAAAELLAALADEFAKDVDAPVGMVRSAAFAPAGVLPDLDAPLPDGGDARIFDAFLARADASPDAVAIEAPTGSFSYEELATRASAVAEQLIAAGLSRGDRVAIVAERGPELIWSMLGAARAGVVFAVLDAAHPEPRLRTLMSLVAPHALLHAGGREAAALAYRLAADMRLPVLDPSEVSPCQDTGPLDRARPADTAYILFTSGSTGRPKAVACSHQPLAHFVDWQTRTFGLGAGDRVTLLSGLAHDPLMRDVFTTLSVGGTLCVPPADITTEPGRLARWVADAKANVIHLTPQLGRLLAAAAQRGGLPDLRFLFWGGDRLRADLIDDVAGLAPAARQISFYGSTETPQAVAWCEVGAGMVRDHAPLGRAVEGVQLAVVGPDLQPVGIGELGEIAVRSNWLSLGYLEQGRILPTNDRRVDSQGRTNLYLTGDRGVVLPDGAVMFVGRSDDQLKIRGHRVDPAEIAAALVARPEVRDAFVLPVGEGDALEIAAAVVPRGGQIPLAAELRSALAARLPDYMVPKRIVCLERAPLLPNGKVDRAALRVVLEDRPAETRPAPSPPANAAERTLSEKWAAVLRGVAVDRHATFASLGGDSLSYVQGYLALEEVIGEPPANWPQMTVAELAALAPAPASAWTAVDMPIALRALAILLVVAKHFGLAPFATGATTSLMLVSGVMLGGLTLPEVFSTRSAAPMLKVVRNIFVPTFLLSLGIFLARLPGSPPEPYILLMTADIQAWVGELNTQDMHLWFVHALLHIQLVMALVLLAAQAAGRFDIPLRRLLWGLFSVGCVARFATPILLNPAVLTQPVLDPTATYFLPTTHFATVMLGALIATASEKPERLRLAALLVAYSGATAWLYGPGAAAFALGGGMLLLFLPQVRLPRLAAPLVLAVAGASLWIYLTHMLVRDALGKIGIAPDNLLVLALAVACGVGLWRGWRWVSEHLRPHLARLTPRAA